MIGKTEGGGNGGGIEEKEAEEEILEDNGQVKFEGKRQGSRRRGKKISKRKNRE